MEQRLTGGPTLEQFWKSYNAVYGTSYSKDNEDLKSQVGYDNILYFPHKLSWNTIYGYWLASPYSDHSDGVDGVYYHGRVDSDNYNHKTNAVRPLVCLPSNAKADWNGTAWELSN